MANGLSPATAARAFRKGLHAAALTVVPNGDVLVCYGNPGTTLPDDIISIGRTTSSQTEATLSTNRTREETLTCEVLFSVYRLGGAEAEEIAADRVYELLELVETYCRVTDTTLGGAVRQCFLTSHDTDGETDPRYITEGRVIEMTATFTALVRVTS